MTLIEGKYFERLSCGQCGIEFYAPQHWVEDRRDHGAHGREFHCPNGHSRCWRDSELDRVRLERDRLKQQTARLEDERRDAERRVVAERARADAESKRAARIKRRAMAAVCPCCNRHFSQLARHMKSKHPNVVPLAQKQA